MVLGRKKKRRKQGGNVGEKGRKGGNKQRSTKI
jgi:hypothetical protein